MDGTVIHQVRGTFKIWDSSVKGRYWEAVRLRFGWGCRWKMKRACDDGVGHSVILVEESGSWVRG